MKARKIAILLAVAAVSVVTLFVITLIDGTALGATDSGRQTTGPVPVVVGSGQDSGIPGSGGAKFIEVLVVPAEGGSSDLLAPFATGNGRDFKALSGPVVDRPGHGPYSSRAGRTAHSPQGMEQ